ncbi:MAG: class I SAM-dependent methyltransferase [Patescibacteria group bacterium]
MGKYNEIKYWNNRKKPTSCSPDYTQTHINYLREQLKNCDNIIDVGSGIGRLFPAYSNLKLVQACDISLLYKDLIIDKSKNYNFEFNWTHLTSIKKLPFEDKQFDCTISSEVLLHQRPEHIIDIMKELLRVSNKVIVITWMEINVPLDNNNKNYNPEKYCFNYNYKKLCDENSWLLKNFKRYKRQIMFTYEDIK